MKIVFVDTTMDGTIIGGAHTFLITLMGALVGHGYEVHFVSKGEPRGQTATGVEQTGAVIHTDFWDRDALVNDSTPILAKQINNLRPDVYVISVSPDLGWTVLPYLDPKIATITIGHSDADTFYNPLAHYSRFVNCGIGVSTEICRHFENDAGVDADRIKWIPYGVMAQEEMPTGTDSSKIELAYVGRLVQEHKRASDVIELVRVLTDRSVDFVLNVIGDGPLMPAFKEELSKEILTGQVRLLGWLRNNELLEHLRRSEVSLLFSDTEGFCISLVEAMANGCCPVVTDIRSGTKQLVEDGVNGFVLPVGDIEGFADKVIQLSRERARLLEMRRAAWATGSQYSVERMVDSYIECFRSSIEDAKANPRVPDPDFPLMESCRSKYPLWLRRVKAKAKGLVRT